jgi:hypothetical protein
MCAAVTFPTGRRGLPRSWRGLRDGSDHLACDGRAFFIKLGEPSQRLFHQVLAARTPPLRRRIPELSELKDGMWPQWHRHANALSIRIVLLRTVLVTDPFYKQF